MRAGAKPPLVFDSCNWLTLAEPDHARRAKLAIESHYELLLKNAQSDRERRQQLEEELAAQGASQAQVNAPVPLHLQYLNSFPVDFCCSPRPRSKRGGGPPPAPPKDKRFSV